jgi:hypothetical protein
MILASNHQLLYANLFGILSILCFALCENVQMRNAGGDADYYLTTGSVEEKSGGQSQWPKEAAKDPPWMNSGKAISKF